MKKIILFINLIVLLSSANAQSGATCSTAKVFIGNDTCFNNDTLSLTEKWFSFVADNSSQLIESKLASYSVGHVHKIVVYSGTCSALIAMDSVKITPTNDTTLSLNMTSLTIGNTYFIKVAKVLTCNPKCSNFDAIFDLCLSETVGVRPCLFMNLEPACCIPHACIDNSTVACDLTICPDQINDFCFYYTDLGAAFPSSYLICEFNGSDIGTQTINASTPGAGGIMCFNPIWSTPGTYTIDIYYYATTNDCDNIYHWIITVNVLAPPVITSFSAAISPPYCYGDPLCFNATASGDNLLYTFSSVYESFWSTTTPSSFCFSVLNPPDETITLTVQNVCGMDTETMIVPISTQQALFSYSDACPGEPTFFTDLSICVGSPATYLWDFGDGTTSTLQNPSHTFPGAGPYNVTFTVTDPSGSSSVSYFVSTSPAILPIVSPVSMIACDPNPVTFTITNYDPANMYSTGILPIGLGTVTAVNSLGQFTVFWTSAGGGTISVTVTDSRGCVNILDIQVNECCLQPPPGQNFNNADVSDITAISGFYTTVGTTIVVTSKAFSINGVFHVNQNLRFDLCTITLGQDAQIIVDPTFAFGSILSHFSACKFMWDGIYASAPNTNVDINESILEDAKNAIVVDNGAKHRILSNLFNKNYESVIIKNYSGIYTSSTGIVDNNVFTCKNYSGVPLLTLIPYATNYNLYPNAVMNAPFSGQRSKTGCVISLITNSTSHYLLARNIFDYLNTGIYSDRSNLKVFNSKFRNMLTVSGGTAIAGIDAIGKLAAFPFINYNLTVGGYGPLEPNTFSNCLTGVNTYRNMNVNVYKNDFNIITKYAVRCESSTFLNGINIKNNDIKNAAVGILCRFNTFCNTQIAENKIKIISGGFTSIGIQLQELSSSGTNADYTVFNNKIQNVKYGITASGLSNAIIDNNKIEIRSVPSARGIEVLVNSLTQITSNEIKSIPATGSIDRGAIYVSMSPQSNIACNTIQNTGYAIQCAGPMTSSSVYNNVQINCTRGIWLSNAGLIGPQGSSSSPSYNKWLGSFTDHTYTSGPLPNPSLGNLSPLYFRNAGPIWYIPSLNNSEVLSGSTPFTINPASGPLSSPSCSYVPPPAILLNQQIAQDQIAFTNQEIKWLSKYSVYRELLNDSLLLSDPIFDNFNDSIEVTAMGKLNKVKKALSGNTLASVPTDLLVAINDNASVSPSNVIETESKTINDILLSNFQNEQEIFDSIQLMTLHTIANECPFIYGDAVYQARVLLLPYDSIGTEYSEPCIENRSMISSSSTNADGQAFVLFPNPNKGIMTLAYHLNENDTGELSIYDLSSRKLKTYPLNSGNTSVTIDENELSNGIYLYQVYVNDKAVKTDRIVIIK